MNINIRSMELKDIPHASKVFCESFNLVGEKWNLETAIKRIKQYFNTDTCWVAEEDNKIIGVLTSKIDNIIDHQELYIDIIAVDPSYQKSGVGKKLFEQAQQYANNSKLKGIWLCASPKIFSYDWYINMGFKEADWKVLYKE